MARPLNYRQIEAAAGEEHLEILGGFTSERGSDLPGDSRSILLLGPLEPGFWAHATAQPEFLDGKPNPLDRWSTRAIEALASKCRCSALFPFGGPPYNPFFSWALRTGRCWQSPVHLLVHDRCGLFVSFRGALACARELDIPPPPDASPCDSCVGRPCVSACPVGAFGPAGFDADGCRRFIGSSSGTDCLSRGCEVRRSCPAGRGYARSEAQSRFHQIAFLNG